MSAVGEVKKIRERFESLKKEVQAKYREESAEETPRATRTQELPRHRDPPAAERGRAEPRSSSGESDNEPASSLKLMSRNELIATCKGLLRTVRENARARLTEMRQAQARQKVEKDAEVLRQQLGDAQTAVAKLRKKLEKRRKQQGEAAHRESRFQDEFEKLLVASEDSTAHTGKLRAELEQLQVEAAEGREARRQLEQLRGRCEEFDELLGHKSVTEKKLHESARATSELRTEVDALRAEQVSLKNDLRESQRIAEKTLRERDRLDTLIGAATEDRLQNEKVIRDQALRIDKLEKRLGEEKSKASQMEERAEAVGEALAQKNKVIARMERDISDSAQVVDRQVKRESRSKQLEEINLMVSQFRQRSIR